MRKPHNEYAGYVAERVSHHPKLPGHIVIYDRDADPGPDIDAEHRWIIAYEPSDARGSMTFVSLPSIRAARVLMKSTAAGADDADFGQNRWASPARTKKAATAANGEVQT